MVYPIKQQLLVAKKIGPFERSIHPQALGPGRLSVAHYRMWPWEMTGFQQPYAARYVAEHPDLEIAAIAPLAAASEYGLEVQAKDIQEIRGQLYTFLDFRGNRASDLKNFKSGPSKVSLALTLPSNLAGAPIKACQPLLGGGSI